MRLGKQILTISLCILLCLPLMAASKAKPKPKPKPKTVPHIVKGTTQLSGEDAKLGETYTLGKDYALNITIKSVEYSCDPIYFDDVTVVPGAGYKFMVIKYNLHNPNSKNRFVNWSTIRFTAVDSKDANYEYSQYMGNTKDNLGVSQEFKPAQKTDVYTYIKIPSDAVIPKLMVSSDDESSKKVLRYFFGEGKNKIIGLKPPYADPSDPTGSKALDTITGEMGTYYNTASFAVRIDSVSDLDKASIGDYSPNASNKLVVVKAAIKNILKSEWFFNWAAIKVLLIDPDGMPTDNLNDVYAASSDKNVSMTFKPGQVMNVRYIIESPIDSTISSVQFRDDQGKTYIIPVK